MKTLIYPDRKGSRISRRAASACVILCILCILAGAVSVLSGGYEHLVPALVAGCVSAALLAALFRVLGCIAYDLETLAATKMVDYTDDADDLKDN